MNKRSNTLTKNLHLFSDDEGGKSINTKSYSSNLESDDEISNLERSMNESEIAESRIKKKITKPKTGMIKVGNKEVQLRNMSILDFTPKTPNAGQFNPTMIKYGSTGSIEETSENSNEYENSDHKNNNEGSGEPKSAIFNKTENHSKISKFELGVFLQTLIDFLTKF